MIKTEEYSDKEKELERLMDLNPTKGTEDGIALLTVAMWIQDYEMENCDIPELTQKEIDDYEKSEEKFRNDYPSPIGI